MSTRAHAAGSGPSGARGGAPSGTATATGMAWGAAAMVDGATPPLRQKCVASSSVLHSWAASSAIALPKPMSSSWRTISSIACVRPDRSLSSSASARANAASASTSASDRDAGRGAGGAGSGRTCAPPFE